MPRAAEIGDRTHSNKLNCRSETAQVPGKGCRIMGRAAKFRQAYKEKCDCAFKKNTAALYRSSQTELGDAHTYLAYI